MAVYSRLGRSLFDPFLMFCLISGALGVSLAQSTFCETLARTGNCSFYPSCVERRVPCGPNGYALGYAGKYCIKFTENMDEFSKDGQGWLVRTRECLTDTLFNSSVYQQNESCDAISKFGFASHPGCYVNSGFCPIIGENLDNLYRLVTIIGVQDLLKRDTLSAMQKTLDLCEKLGYHIVVHDIWELIKKLIG